MVVEDVATAVFPEPVSTDPGIEIVRLTQAVAALEIRNGELLALLECRRTNLGSLIGASEALLLHMHDLAHRRTCMPEELAYEAGKALRDFETHVNYIRVVGLGLAARPMTLFPKNGESGDGPEGGGDGGSGRAARMRRVPR